MSESIYWVGINEIIGPGNLNFYLSLIQEFGSLERAWDKNGLIIKKVLNQYPKQADTFLSKRIQFNPEKTLHKLEKLNILPIYFNNHNYPSLLRNIYSPPPVLYVLGNLPSENYMNFSIVGSRKATSYGLNMAKKIARELSMEKCVITSGLARGIDTEAHQGCLEAKGITLAVLGSGLDNIYPRENNNLALEIVSKGGAIISEFPLGTPPLSRNFPIRNRIISGLANGVIIVEGGRKSGSLITAELALQQGKDVFAIPGRITDEMSQGPLWLIQQGAKLILSVQDVLEEYGQVVLFSSKNNDTNNFDLLEKKIMDILRNNSLTLDEISTITKLPIQDLSYKITLLEMNKKIIRVAGNKFNIYSI